MTYISKISGDQYVRVGGWEEKDESGDYQVVLLENTSTKERVGVALDVVYQNFRKVKGECLC